MRLWETNGSIELCTGDSNSSRVSSCLFQTKSQMLKICSNSVVWLISIGKKGKQKKWRKYTLVNRIVIKEKATFMWEVNKKKYKI